MPTIHLENMSEINRDGQDEQDKRKAETKAKLRKKS
jgi:hypothetical protein